MDICAFVENLDDLGLAVGVDEDGKKKEVSYLRVNPESLGPSKESKGFIAGLGVTASDKWLFWRSLGNKEGSEK